MNRTNLKTKYRDQFLNQMQNCRNTSKSMNFFYKFTENIQNLKRSLEEKKKGLKA